MSKTWDTLPLRHEDFAWPYWGMLRDLRVAIRGQCNYLAALGLLVYTEVIGRHISATREPSKRPEQFDREESFYCFYAEHMDQPRERGQKIYEHFRHGAAHTPDPDLVLPDSTTVRIQLPGGRTEQGLAEGAIVLDSGRIKVFLVNAYFRDFQRGLVKAARKHPAVFLASPGTGGSNAPTR